MAYPLENLLPSNVLQSSIQVPDPLDNVGQLFLILAFDFAGLANCQVEGKLHAFGIVGEPASAGCVRGPEADAMFAGITGGEGESTGGGPLLVYNTVVIVENFLSQY
jgi:hypothetical protein